MSSALRNQKVAIRQGSGSMQAIAESALKTILLVDDDLELLGVMAELFEVHGYATFRASDGQSALDLLRKMTCAPLLIVLDMSMPVLDGRRFLELRAKDPFLLGIPVVVVSGSDAPESPLTNIKAYLRKPVSINQLIAIVESTSAEPSFLN